MKKPFGFSLNEGRWPNFALWLRPYFLFYLALSPRIPKLVIGPYKTG